MRQKMGLGVKYQNNLNLVPLKSFNAKEMDLFFSLCARMKKHGNEEICFSFEELRELSDYKMTANRAFVKDLDTMYSKMLQLTYRDELFDENNEEEGFKRFVLFTGFEVSTKKQTLKVSVNPKLEPVINKFSGEFTRFELSAFTSLRSSYSKTLFRLLMQYRSTGYYEVSIEKFREIMDIPSSYKQMGQIDQRVLNPAIEELNNYFENLDLKKIKAKKGNKIARLKFTFTGIKSDLPKLTLHNWLEGE